MGKGIVVIFVFFVSITSQALGNADGGGGGAFVCSHPDGTDHELSVLLDLWEANYIYGWPVSRTQSAVDTQLEKAFKKLRMLSPVFSELVEAELLKIRVGAKMADGSVVIEPPEDANNRYSKKDCRLEGMMYYEGVIDRLIINPYIFGILETKTDEAAAWMHEAVYKIARDKFEMTDSEISRRFVGCLFSTDRNCAPRQTVSELLKGRKDARLCKSRLYTFYYLPQEDREWPWASEYAFVKIGSYDYSKNPYLIFRHPKGTSESPKNSLVPFGFPTWDFRVTSNHETHVHVGARKFRKDSNDYGMEYEGVNCGPVD